jgi:hypothetical protein
MILICITLTMHLTLTVDVVCDESQCIKQAHVMVFNLCLTIQCWTTSRVRMGKQLTLDIACDNYQ